MICVTNLDSLAHTPAWVWRQWHSSAGRLNPCHRVWTPHRMCDRMDGHPSAYSTQNDPYHLQKDTINHNLLQNWKVIFESTYQYFIYSINNLILSNACMCNLSLKVHFSYMFNENLILYMNACTCPNIFPKFLTWGACCVELQVSQAVPILVSLSKGFLNVHFQGA